MTPILKGKSIGLDQNNAKRRALDLENQETSSGWYSPIQGFNLLQISPNWFLGNWTLDLRLKWALDFIRTNKRKVQICSV
jgi:hypothetical protein